MFNRIDDGFHDAEITSVKTGTDGKDHNYLQWNLKIRGGLSDGIETFLRFYGYSDNEKRWTGKNAERIGITYNEIIEILPQAKSLVGRTIRISARTKTFNGRDWQDVYFINRLTDQVAPPEMQELKQARAAKQEVPPITVGTSIEEEDPFGWQ